jgi:zinc protease
MHTLSRLSLRSATALSLVASLALGGCGPKAPPAEPVAEQEAALPGGMKLVESFTPAPGEIGIAYDKYELPNGLTVILHEDDSDPLVHVDVTYHVGSGREEVGRSGFAHFFEHMMFQGSEHVGDEQHFKIITESGGTLNGTTNSDRTNYYETVPSNQLEKMLWLEADRMGFLLDAVTQEKFEVQRETVKNERGQRVDNAPYGLLNERVSEAMYPEGHPYSWSVIGYMEDLDRADLEDLKRFFLRWYGPNNAVLTIGGRLDEQQTLEWVAKYFGSIPRGPEVEPPVYEPVTLDADRYISMEDNVALPLVYMAWPTVHVRHPDEAPLDVLMNILGVGKTSLLYKNLVKDGTAVQAQANHGCAELSCTFTLLALPNPTSGKNLADIEQVLRDSLVEFEERGAQPDDLQRVKAGIVADMVFGLESVSGKVSTLAANETFTGDPNYLPRDIERYSSVTADDVMRVYEQYIKGKPAVIMSIVPKGQTELIAREDTWERYERTIPEREEAGDLQMRRATDDFDRSVMPPAGDNPVITPPPLWRSELANGIEVIGAVNDETPTTALRIEIDVGQRHESLDKLGLAQLTAAMLDEATTESTTEELSNRLDKLGASVSVGSGDESTSITLRTLTEHLDEALAIVVEKLREPAFEQADFDRLKAQTLQGIEVSKTRPAVTASAEMRRQLYGRDNAFAHPDEGTTATVESLTLDDVKGFYEAHYGADVASVLVVSDLSSDEVVAKLQGLADWADAEQPPEDTLQPFPELAAGT